MANSTDPARPQIVYSCVSRRVLDGEIFIRQHVIDYIISGESEVYFGTKRLVHKAGDFRFAVKNRLSKFVKDPGESGEYRSVSICIDQDTLLGMSTPQSRTFATSLHYDNVFLLNPNQYFRHYIDSLLPYVENGNRITGELLRTKVKEAVLIFMETNPGLKDLLFDFNEPGKIDLQAYMQEHYQYNGDLKDFAYLTGRSLSTFKRDFEKIFHTTPSRWLLQKKLEAAHLLLKQKRMKATEVFLEVGFRDYSHFSVAFKKMYGTAPSML